MVLFMRLREVLELREGAQFIPFPQFQHSIYEFGLTARR